MPQRGQEDEKAEGLARIQELSIRLFDYIMPKRILLEKYVKLLEYHKGLSITLLTSKNQSMGESLFPSKVMFSKNKDGYFADIL